MTNRLALAFRTLVAEGPHAALDRALDHLAYWRERGSAQPIDGGANTAPAVFRSPVLHLLATPPKPWFGGVQVHVARRRALESAHAPFALLFPERGRYRLEVWHGTNRRAWWMSPSPAGSPASLLAPRFEHAVERAAWWVGARLLHFENLAGLPLGSALNVVERGLPAVVSAHDYAGFCPRPHLIERPMLRFCHYSRDAERCARCLAADGTGGGELQVERRELAARLLARAEAVVYASAFLRGRFLELFPGLAPERQLVRPPLTALDPPPLAAADRRPAERSARLRVAFVGSVKPHKGSRLFAEVVDGLAPAERRRFELSAYGGGDVAELSALRRRGVRVRGYYRASGLPARLRRDRIDLALVPSIYPEPYGLTLDECLAAGVPVVAFDFGAPAERLRRWGGGWLVSPEEGAAGILRLLRELIGSERWQCPAALAPAAEPLLDTPRLDLPWLDYGDLYRQALEPRQASGRGQHRGSEGA